mgnify:CR=1 FL=1|jgi:prevent-host-death family protein
MARVSFVDDLTPISDFRVHTAEIVAKVKKTKRPVILTQRGRSAAVLEDVREYERKADRLELLESILAGMRAAEKGAVVSHAKAMAELDKMLHD